MHERKDTLTKKKVRPELERLVYDPLVRSAKLPNGRYKISSKSYSDQTLTRMSCTIGSFATNE
ncbi:hypothetical protein TcasGA2_TC009041 [Tribolium castaneum]|uniref:Uncharacterized protein n=1 Tax=Tribolium castaneum TaxID=7070 RepID=D6WPP5_TRICA|nr:hypothetical protein TcasGA2_TC009041 [Tribolium castaneum]